MSRPMAAEESTGEHIVLVGAGHAHLYIASQAARLLELGARVTLIAPGDTGYSGMASGVLGGRYEPGENRIDPARVARASGVHYRADRVTGLDPAQRLLRLEGGERLAYDRVSFNVGSVVDVPATSTGGPRVWPVKPVTGLAELRAVLLEELGTQEGEAPEVVVLGGGATGSEVTANLLALRGPRGQRLGVTVVERDGRLLPAAPASAALALAGRLRQRGARVLTATRFEGLTNDGIRTDRGPVAARHVIVATGLLAPALVEQLGVPADRSGGIHVDETLRSPADERVFAVGDCAAFLPSPLPRIGVFGVRQAPILLRNLAAAVSGNQPIAYRPQRRWLSILDLGDGTGLLLYGRLWFIGRPAQWLKQWLDRRFVQSFRRD
ncbi:MAG: FAD-dependent oxidoreductase [Halofilum sp. (in: g-proteobacteria)]|nr:FAD-dependent oxidoreductase [Halofilum sp. (in: g-proteobacteria)]